MPRQFLRSPSAKRVKVEEPGSTRILVWIVGGIGIGIVAALLLGRFATLAGILLMLLGMGPMTALYIYSEIAQSTRDMSAEGMLSTLALILIAPFGTTVCMTGLLRRE